MKGDLHNILNTPIERFTRRMFTQIIRKLSAFVVKSNFTVSEIAALHIIDREGAQSIQALAAQLNLSISAASRVVSGLVRKKILLSRKDAQDARARVVTLSKGGERLLNEMSLERVAAIFEVIKTMPPEIPKRIMAAITDYENSKGG